MHARLNLIHHKHSGRVQAHEHTSYLPLIILLIIVGIVLMVTTASAQTRPGPAEGSIGLSGTMPGPAPATGATITSPRNQQRFGTSPITITGTCPQGTLVQIFKNDIFAGSAACGESSTYSVEVDLLVGQNVLIARVYDSLNQAGPDSNPVTVFYDILPDQVAPLSSLNFGNSQLILSTDAAYRGIFPEQKINIPVTIVGGTPPYALNVQWGDTTNKVVPRNDNLPFTVDHVYKKPGIYQVTLQASDAQGRVAFLSVVAFVNGQPAVASASGGPGASPNKLLALWPLYVSSIAIVLSFWLGEKREKQILTHHTSGAA